MRGAVQRPLPTRPLPLLPLIHNLDRLRFHDGPELSLRQRPMVPITHALPMVMRLASDRRQQTDDPIGTRRNGGSVDGDEIAQTVSVRHAVSIGELAAQ